MQRQLAILMADLSGYTALTEVHGAATAAGIIDRYFTLASESLKGTSELKERVGDQLVIVASSADDLLQTAIILAGKTFEEPHFLSIHAGLHYGMVLEQNYRYYGSTVNLTARIASKAGEGQLLCSEDFWAALEKRHLYQFRSQGRLQFKNVLESKAIYEVTLPSVQHPGKMVTDPVCHMHLEYNDALVSERYAGRIYHFCSVYCRDLFMNRTNLFNSRKLLYQCL